LHLAEGCKLAVGLGEAPLLRQATFSLWQDTEAMNNYARTGAHMDAIKAAHEHRFFSESMFVRFVPVEFSGSWQGRSFG
jgi:spheroidene monooxygenase